ncbi:MAG: SIR2 family protein [Pirellulales bacterium]
MSWGNDEPNPNTLKCRDDHQPIAFAQLPGDQAGTKPTFRLADGTSSPWIGSGEEFGPEKLRSRIEPWLTALSQSEHFSLLVGSGLSNAVHHLATGNLLPGMGRAEFGSFDGVIGTEAKRSAALAGRSEGNFEDQIRVACELLRGQQILASTDANAKAKAEELQTKLNDVLSQFAESVRKGEHGLKTAPADKRENAFNYLVSFLMSFASRAGTRDRLNIFTTNYDRFIEAGADAAGLHLLDRFVGSVAPIFRSTRLDLDMHYNPPGIRGEPRYVEGVARFTKLHGSLDWGDCEHSICRLPIPFGAESLKPFVDALGAGDANAMRLMIYPNASKDRETSCYPYVELFRDFAAAACRPNHTLFSFGYSFGDEHINRVIEDMLTIPSTHLVVASHSDPLARIMKTYEQLGRHAQITLLIGDHVGSFQSLVDYYLPKPAIDRTTFRMAELLKARWGANHGDKADPRDSSTSSGGDDK